ncbi:MAG: SagB/ThcOx family dehydrogenase, partial [Acidobacteria bacterium]|nr:SagB/ThcOx family dehydrogenase [Acidobacteriota bacterium]
MTNRDIQAAWNYHEGTKHSLLSLRSGGHYLDWSNHPLAFKIYSTLDPIPLPRDFDPLQMSALEAAASLEFPPSHQRVPDRKMLAQVLHFSAGITKRGIHPGGEIFFRAAACTGALYSVELYLVTGDLPDLEAGVYHFGPGDFSLRKLRAGDFRRLVVRASGEEPSVAHAPVILVSTGTYWRNAWKYQARTYRHFGWDNGTILAN